MVSGIPARPLAVSSAGIGAWFVRSTSIDTVTGGDWSPAASARYVNVSVPEKSALNGR
jgi:hypothetical protein